MTELYAATLRIIGSSEAEARAHLDSLIYDVIKTIGFVSTDGTIQLSVENVTDNQDVVNRISYGPWKP